MPKKQATKSSKAGTKQTKSAQKPETGKTAASATSTGKWFRTGDEAVERKITKRILKSISKLGGVAR